LQMTQQSDNWRILQSHNNADTGAAPSVRSSASVSHSNAALSSSQHFHATLEPPPPHLLQRAPQNFDRASSADAGDGYRGASQRGLDPEPSVLLIPHANGPDPFGGSGFLAREGVPSQIDGKLAVQELLRKEVCDFFSVVFCIAVMLGQQLATLVLFRIHCTAFLIQFRVFRMFRGFRGFSALSFQVRIRVFMCHQRVRTVLDRGAAVISVVVHFLSRSQGNRGKSVNRHWSILNVASRIYLSHRSAAKECFHHRPHLRGSFECATAVSDGIQACLTIGFCAGDYRAGADQRHSAALARPAGQDGETAERRRIRVLRDSVWPVQAPPWPARDR
jgi:hypothetical protein